MNPPSEKRRAQGHGTFDPKRIGPVQDVREYPGESVCI